ncbi:MAG: membrane protein insertase YidC [Spirochaetia bacterium]|nr:membrane protein insertase YidC [Spirochaetia bacterium]
MDKNTVLAIVLFFVVITGSMLIQSTFFSPSVDEQVATETTAGKTTEVPTEVAESQSTNDFSSDSFASVPSASAWNSGLSGSFTAVDDSAKNMQFHYETNVFDVTFDTAGASIASLKLKNHKSIDGSSVDLIFNGNTGKNAFLMYAGDDRTNPIDCPFSYKVEKNKVIFTKTFAMIKDDGTKGNTFTLTKTYTFGEDDYLFQIDIQNVNSVNKALPLDFGNNAYTLAFEPQVGPSFTSMPNNNYSYRRFYYMKDGAKKKTTVKLSDKKFSTDDYLTWGAVVGKYFSIIAIPDATKYHVTMVQDSDVGNVVQTDSMYWTRPAVKSASKTDTFRFYCGPQLKEAMRIYDNKNDNAFGLSGLKLEGALETSAWLGWLEAFLMLCLNLIYKIIPNYGIAIIVITILLKLATNPLTKKSTESSAKMAQLSPQIKELQDKYSNNPDKLNKEMSELYQKEHINPVSGCLPMLIQFPILIAFYGLLNRHFELRGAMFIPGWIPDLSQPDTVLTFKFIIPFIGNQLHLLPIIYTVSMIYSMKMTQASQGEAAGQTASMMKFMTYGMPLIFFFVLYSAPSGLLLYWSVMNLVTMIQQAYANSKLKKKEVSGKSNKTFKIENKKNKKK